MLFWTASFQLAHGFDAFTDAMSELEARGPEDMIAR